jgi:PAS domain S-box-containing protein
MIIQTPSVIGLRRRLTRVMALAFALAFLTVAVAVGVYEQTTFKPRAVETLTRQAATLAAVLLPSMEFADATTAQNYLNTQRAYPDITGIGLYSTAGERVADYVRDSDDSIEWPAITQQGGYSFADNKLQLWFPIVGNGRIAGYLLMRAESPPLFARLPQYGIMLGAIILALLAVSIVLTRGVRRTLIEPLERLTEVTELVTQQKDYAVRAQTAGPHELVQLASALNQMLDAVQQRDTALRASESRMRSIIDAEPECVKLLSRDGELMEINPAGMNMLEAISFEEVKSQPLLSYVAESYRDSFVAMHRSVVGGASAGVEFEAIGLRGTRRWLDTRAVPLRQEDGSVAAVLAITRDITERKRMERALATRVEQEAAVVQLGMDAFAVHELRQLLGRAANLVAATLHADFVALAEVLPSGAEVQLRAGYGFPHTVGELARTPINSGTLVGRTLEDRQPLLVTDAANDPRLRDINLLLRYGVVSSISVVVPGPSAPWGVLMAHCKVRREFSVDDVRFMQAIANLLAQAIQRERADNARAQAEMQLRQSQKMEALGRLAGGIAHDFNNLLSAILGNAQLARQDLGEGHAALVSVDEIKTAGCRARELVQRILAFSRQQEPHRARVDPTVLVEEAVRLLRATLPAGVELQTSYSSDIPHVLADAAQINQAMLNLGTNAWQALPGGVGRIDVTVSTCEQDSDWCVQHPATAPGRFVLIRVCDTGVGIDQSIRERLFEPFFTTKAVGEGTGLGLSVVHGVMQAHHGAITVESEPNRGATFSLYFPALDGDAPTAPIRSVIDSDRPIVGAGQEIMYVDDEEPLVFLATRLLERMGYRVCGYTRADEAIAAYRNEPDRFDLVITDLSMPGMSGMDVAREILHLRPHAKVLLVSGYLRQSDLDLARAIGVCDVVLKPNTVEELGPVVNALVAPISAAQ